MAAFDDTLGLVLLSRPAPADGGADGPAPSFLDRCFQILPAALDGFSAGGSSSISITSPPPSSLARHCGVSGPAAAGDGGPDAAPPVAVPSPADPSAVGDGGVPSPGSADSSPTAEGTSPSSSLGAPSPSIIAGEGRFCYLLRAEVACRRKQDRLPAWGMRGCNPRP